MYLFSSQRKEIQGLLSESSQLVTITVKKVSLFLYNFVPSESEALKKRGRY